MDAMRYMENALGKTGFQVDLPAVLGVMFFFLLIPAAYSVDAQSGWPQSTGGRVSSSPTLIDLDGDEDFEVIIGTGNETVYAWHGNGTNVFGWPKSPGFSATSSPAVGDVDGDGDFEVVAVFTRLGLADVPLSNVYVWQHDGTLIFSRPITESVISSPAMGDLDGDGDLEIVISAVDRKVFIWNISGEDIEGWPKTTGGSIYGSPALGDLDGDGDLEIVLGALDGKTYAWHHDGSLDWSFDIGAVYESSPAMADINDDGNLEIIIGSVNGLYALHHNGSLFWSNTNMKYVSSPAIGDIDGDDDFEIVVGTNSLASGNKVYAIDDEGNEIWNVQLRKYELVEYRETVTSSPVIGDIDGDGSVEIIATTSINNENLNSGRIYAFESDGTLDWYESINDDNSNIITSSPAIGDTDGDSDMDVIAGSLNENVYIWDLGGTYNPEKVRWPMFRHNAQHTGTLLITNELNIIQAQLDKSYYPGGDIVVISCKLRDFYGVRVSADSVTVEIQKPDGSNETVILSEVSDGDYNGTYTNTSSIGSIGAHTATIRAVRSGYTNGTAGLNFGVANPITWHYRIPVDVNATSTDTDATVEVTLNFTEELESLGVSEPFQFDINSPRVYEANSSRDDRFEVPSHFQKKIAVPSENNIADGKTATASRQASGAYTPSRAVDGTIEGNPWAGGLYAPDWLKIDLGEPTYMAKVVIKGYLYLGITPSFPKDFTIQVSMDDSTYTTVAEVIGNTDINYTHHFTSQVYGRYIKLDVTQNNGHTRTFVSEFELYPAIDNWYEPYTNAVGNLTWIMNGTTNAGTTRYYNVYFDFRENGTKLAPDYGVDYSGMTISSSVNFTKGTAEEFTEPNKAPTAIITSPSNNSVFNFGDLITFTGWGLDSDGVPMAYNWTSNRDGELSNDISFSTAGLSMGPHAITLTVMDDDTVTNDTNLNIRVNIPPTASIDSPADESSYYTGDTIIFDSTVNDPDGSVAAYEWNSNIDGHLANSSSFSATGLSLGSHVITLKATDSDGAAVYSFVTITISARPPSDTGGGPTSPTTTSPPQATDAPVPGDTGTVPGGDGHAAPSGVAQENATQLEIITLEDVGYDVRWLMDNETISPGSFIQIKFTAYNLITGRFAADSNVLVEVYGPDMELVATYTDKELLIDSIKEQYVVNFQSTKDMPTGKYTVKVVFPNAKSESFMTFNIHTTISKIVDIVVSIVKSILSIFGI